MSARSIDELLERTAPLALPLPGEPRRATQGEVYAVRTEVTASLSQEDFLLDCVERELQRLRSAKPDAGLFPFATSGDGRVLLAFGYWAPRSGTGPHEHVDWTVTAVVHNRLDVTTFHYEALARDGRLVPKNHFQAERGRAGQIHEPCVHAPENPTERWSLSLHLLGPNEDGQLADRELGLTRFQASGAEEPHLRTFRGMQARERAHGVLVELLASFASERARSVLAALADEGSASIREAARRALGERASRASPEASGEPALDRALAASALLPLRVEEAADVASLRLGPSADAPVLLRTSLRAAEALRFVASARRFRPEELPGLSAREKQRLARALLSLGLYELAS